MTDERKTPRTDYLLQWHGYNSLPPLEQRYAMVCEHARQLEREIAIVKAVVRME